MCDLSGQYERLKPEIDREIEDVFKAADFVHGSKVKLFEQELAEKLSVRHIITTASGTDALMTALMCLGLAAGDEVIVPAFTFIATAEVVSLLGLKPRFVDVDYNTMCIDPAATAKAINAHTRAIIPVHLFGQNADIEALAQFGLPIIEDACQSINAGYTYHDGRQAKSGTMGLMGCTSFFPSKNLGCYGDGGAIFTNDDAIAEKARMIANHGMKVRYHHEMIGLNSRLDTLQAAVLRAKLPHLDDFIARRRAAARYYNQALKADKRFLLPHTAPYTEHTYHQYTLRATGEARDTVRQRLSDAGVPTAIYYPLPLHQQPVYHTDLTLPVAEQLSHEVLSLPMHTELTAEQLAYITNNI